MKDQGTGAGGLRKERKKGNIILESAKVDKLAICSRVCGNMECPFSHVFKKSLLSTVASVSPAMFKLPECRESIEK